MGIKESAIHFARQVKHAGLVAQKRTSRTYSTLRWRGINAFSDPYSRATGYQFDAARYRRSFLVRDAPHDDSQSVLPQHVFAVWTGDNDLTPNRTRNLGRLQSDLGVPLELVTPQNLDRWIVPGHPLHPAYEGLSLVHRSDYLRAYLAHHHGGGYVDIKKPLEPWTGAFDVMQSDPDLWLTGYREISAQSAVRVPGPLGRDIAVHHRKLIGNGAFITRSHTPFTGEWLREVERRLDYYADQLAEFPGGVRGEAVGYPVSWTRLLGGVFQPLQLKYLDRVQVDDSLLLEFEDYQ